MRVWLIFFLLFAHASNASVLFDVTKSLYGAKGDGVSDDTHAIQRAIIDAAKSGGVVYLPPGEYFLTDHLRPVANSHFIIEGESAATVSIVSKPGIVAIYSGTRLEDHRPVLSASIKKIKFKGSGRDGMKTAISLRGVRGLNSLCEISDCIFVGTERGMVWLEAFEGSVQFSENFSYRCRSLNIVNSRNILVSRNKIIFNEDNAIAISRGCKNVVISDNIIENAGINGIFVGAVLLENRSSDRNLSILAGKQEGRYTLTSSGSFRFDYDSVGAFYTLSYSDLGYVTCEVEALIDEYNVEVVGCFYRANPKTLLGLKTQRFMEGPYSAPENVVITGNVVDGTFGRGIALTEGPKNVSVTSNVLSRLGIRALPWPGENNKIHVDCLSGEAKVFLKDAWDSKYLRKLEVGDAILIKPYVNVAEPLVGRVKEIGEDWLRLDEPVCGDYLNAEFYEVDTTEDGRLPFADGILVNGWFLGESHFEYAENINLNSNVISGFSRMGVVIGSVGGSVEKIMMSDNIIEYEAYAGGFARPYFVFVDGGELMNEMPLRGVLISDNMWVSAEKDVIKPFRFDEVNPVTIRVIEKSNNLWLR